MGPVDEPALSVEQQLELLEHLGLRVAIRKPSEISPSLYGNTPLTDLFVGCWAFV